MKDEQAYQKYLDAQIERSRKLLDELRAMRREIENRECRTVKHIEKMNENRIGQIHGDPF